MIIVVTVTLGTVEFHKVMPSNLEDCSRLNSQNRVENLGVKEENWITRFKNYFGSWFLLLSAYLESK